MTRPTKIGTSAPIILHALGYTPEEVEPEFPDPVDRALSSNGGYAVSLHGELPELVQSASGTNTAVLSSAPTVGNVLILWKARHNTLPVTLQTGFTDIDSVENLTGNVRSGRAMYRVVQSGDTVNVAQSAMGQTDNEYRLTEWSGATYDGFTSQDTQANSQPFTSGGTTTPDAGTANVIVGMDNIYQGSNEPVVNSIAPSAGSVEIFDNSDGLSHDVVWVGYQEVPSASGGYVVGGTTSNADGRPVSYCGVSVILQGGDNIWSNPEPRVNDGDDTTYEEIGGPDVLRIDLGAAYGIVRSRLLIGSELAGAKTYVIKGANEGDFSDEVTLDSESWTATGSYTGDDIDFLWEPGTAYRYFELSGTDETRRIYTWELYEADQTEGQDHVHPDLQDQIDDLDPYLPVSSATPNTGDVWTWGGTSWAPRENVRRITANGSNTLVGPFINFANGSNTLLTLDAGPGGSVPSNTIRIHSTASGGGNILSANGSNSLAAIVNLVAGSGIALGVSGQDITITNTGAGGGGSSLFGGEELDYVQNTSQVSPTATTEATANTCVTGSAIAYDGSTTVMLEFYAETVRPSNSAANNNISLWLYDGSSSIGRIALVTTPAANTMGTPVHVMRRLTPSNATHTYSIRASVNTGTGLVSAGAGGTATPFPMFIRITRV